MRWIIPLFICAVLGLGVLQLGAGKIRVSSGTIVFLGDSITSGYGLAAGAAYPALINIKGMTMLNLGRSGSDTDDGLQRLKDYFDSGGNARLIVIALGANDILEGVPPSVTKANLQEMVSACKSRGVPVLLCGIWIPGKVETEDVFGEIADTNEVPLVRDLMQGEQTQQNLLQDDNAHPNETGQKIIAQKMEAALRKAFAFGS